MFIKNQPFTLILNQSNPVHSLKSCFCEINFNIIFLSVTASKLVSSTQGFQTKFSLMPSFSWDIARRRLALPYRRFGITYRCQLQCSSSPLGLLDYQLTSYNTQKNEGINYKAVEACSFVELCTDFSHQENSKFSHLQFVLQARPLNSLHLITDNIWRRQE